MSAAKAADIALPPEAESSWTLTVAPYVWAAGLKGDVGLFGREPVEIDMSFSDVLSDLKFGGMVVSDLHNGSFGVFSDLIYVKTRATESIERALLDTPVELTASVETDSFTGTLMGEFRLLNSEQMAFDLMAGARLWSVDNDISAKLKLDGSKVADFSGSDGDTWVDPMIGVRSRIDTGTPFYFTGWGMIGGFGVSSDFAWDVMGGVGYQWNDWFATVVGYRALSVDYSNGGFVYDVIQHGVVAGAGMRV